MPFRQARSLTRKTVDPTPIHEDGYGFLFHDRDDREPPRHVRDVRGGDSGWGYDRAFARPPDGDV